MKPLTLILLTFVATASMAMGQTITWTAATNPHVVNGTYTVPAGQTLVLEAGTRVQINSNSTLQIDGQLVSNGTSTKRVLITGADNYSASLDVTGTATLNFTDIQAKTVPDTNGVLIFADCVFSGFGTVFNGQVLQMENSRAPYLQFDRCAFQGDGTNQSASLYVAYCTVVLRNTNFRNGSYCNLYLNNISVTNATQAGLQLAGDTRNGTNVLIGPNVILSGNDYPINLTIAGLYPQSNVPATGNRNNFIHLSEKAGSGGKWPKFAIPYYNDASPLQIGNVLNILPGVTIKMAPFSYMIDNGFGDGVRAFGTKTAPITFERADPAQAWYDLHADRTEG